MSKEEVVYCTSCGSKMVFKYYRDGFCSDTGKPVMTSSKKCPNGEPKNELLYVLTLGLFGAPDYGCVLSADGFH